MANVAFWLRTSQWFSVVGSVVEHWLLKPGILGFRIPGSSVVAFLHQKMSSFFGFNACNGSIRIPGLKAFPCKVLPQTLPQNGLGPIEHDYIPSHYLKIVVSGGR